MLPSYLQPTENIKAKVRLRSLLKSQIPRPKRKNRDNQSTGRHLRSKFKGGFEVLRQSPARARRNREGSQISSRVSSLPGRSRFRKDCRPSSLKKKVDTETSPSEHQIGGVTALARISDSLVNSSIVSFNV